MGILGFLGKVHWSIKDSYMQIYANPDLDLSIFQFKYYLFWPIEYVKRG